MHAAKLKSTAATAFISAVFNVAAGPARCPFHRSLLAPFAAQSRHPFFSKWVSSAMNELLRLPLLLPIDALRIDQLQDLFPRTLQRILAQVDFVDSVRQVFQAQALGKPHGKIIAMHVESSRRRYKVQIEGLHAHILYSRTKFFQASCYQIERYALLDFFVKTKRRARRIIPALRVRRNIFSDRRG